MTRITVVIEDHGEGIHLGQQLAGGRVVAVASGDSLVHVQSGPASAQDLILMNEVCELMGRTRSGVDKLRARDPGFPKPWKDGGNSRSRIYFVRSEIERYLSGRFSARHDAKACNT